MRWPTVSSATACGATSFSAAARTMPRPCSTAAAIPASPARAGPRSGWIINPSEATKPDPFGWECFEMDSEFHRIRRLPPYVFAEVNRLKAAARAAGRDIIDFGMGNPDGATPKHIVDKLIEAVQNPRTHRYSESRGIPGLRKAIAAYYKRRFNVDLDPEREVIVTIGSKEGLANLAQAITSPGDTILVPNPSYPIHAFGFILAGASIRHLPPASTQAEFMNLLERAAMHSIPAPIAVVLNFPSNPTAEVRDLDFYAAVIDFCRSRGIYVLSDLAYSEIYFDDVPPPSALQVPGAREITVEFGSLSKTYSMPGWRIGYAVGNARLIGA